MFDLHESILEDFAEAQSGHASEFIEDGFGFYDSDASVARAKAWRSNPENAKLASKRATEWKFKQMLTVGAETRTVEEWAALKNMSPYTLAKRLERGWGPWGAVNEPVRKPTGAAEEALIAKMATQGWELGRVSHYDSNKNTIVVDLPSKQVPLAACSFVMGERVWVKHVEEVETLPGCKETKATKEMWLVERAE